ncbi:outer membrane beta-barrel protein [candidate division KSB1 bacterium]|nr:outer membrane beta-barrel protein [candidate division KSB1 bacterium]
MKRYIFMVLLLCLAGSPLYAQMMPHFFINGGMAMPMGPDEFKDYWKTGFNVGGGAEFAFGPNMKLVGTVDYTSFGINEDELLDEFAMGVSGISVDGGSLSSIAVLANVKFSIAPPMSPISPYLIGGAGMFFLSGGEADIKYQGMTMSTIESETDNYFGVGVGAGVDLTISPNMSLFIEGKYNIAFAEEDNMSYLPIKAGLLFH